VLVRVGLRVDGDDVADWDAGATVLGHPAACAVRALILNPCLQPEPGARYRFTDLDLQCELLTTSDLSAGCVYLTRAGSDAVLALLRAPRPSLAGLVPRR